MTAKRTRTQLKREAAKEANRDLRAEERVAAMTRYRMCINHQTLEMLSTVSTISATETVKEFSDVEYRICSVDGNMHPVTLFTIKLWDLILLKLTEVVPYKNRFQWYDNDDKYGYGIPDEKPEKEWYIVLSIKTIAECLNLSTNADDLAHLCDRIIDAIKVLKNISIIVTERFRKECKIDGYLDVVGVQEHGDIDGCVMKSNAIFFFFINPQLIAHLDTQPVGLYHFVHAWLHFSGNSENAYAAAKRFGRLYSQNTHNRRVSENVGFSTPIGTLRKHLPSLNNGKDKENRLALDKAMKAIPGAKYGYDKDKEPLTFEELTKLKLRRAGYDRVKVAVRFLEHPKTSDNKVTRDKIKDMNDDAMYVTDASRRLYAIEITDELVNHKGILKRPEKLLEVSSDGDNVLQDADDIAATENIATVDNAVPVNAEKVISR